VSGMSTDGPLTVACNVRGASQFLLDLVMQPELATELLHYITDATVMRIKTYRKRLGQPEKSPSFGFADDSIQLISTDLYEEMVLPHHKKLVSELSGGEPGGIHLCGDSTRHFRLIRDELNVMSFDTGYPVDFGALRETLGPDVEIQGGPSVPFLQAATADETAQETKRILQSGIMRGGRFILREGNNLAPDIPDENLWAMYETVREYGRYPASCDVSTHITEQLA
jgi:uroporphyrinogen-III decarboxylase